MDSSFLDGSFLNVLAAVSFGMLLLVTGGIVYLTLAEWRDRRRRESEKREARRR